jgi:ABC-type branched-subunit amino acid transport system ATPase component/ABC-type branched-subunit amino acid transport system permease subunit
MTKRARRIGLAAVAAAAVPPLLSRVAGDLTLPVVGRTFAFTDLRALTLGIGVCFAVGAIALNLLMGYAGQISLGHAALLGIGAYASGVVTVRAVEAPWIVGMLAAGAAGAVVALVLGLPALRLKGLYLAIVTIAFGFMVQETLFLWKPLSGGSSGLELPKPRAGTFVFSRDADYLALLLLVFVFVWVIDENVLRTKLGRAFHGIREDESVAQSFGVDVTRYKLLAFVVSGAMAGLAGAMLGHLVTFVNSDTFRYEISLTLVVMVVVGGLGSRTGVVTAALFFAALPRLFGFLKGWDQLVGAIMLMHLMSRHPGGIAGAFREARERKAVKAAREQADTDDSDELPKLPSLPRPSGLPERTLATDGPLLAANNVSVRFGGLHALEDVTLEVPSGKIVGLIGPNGAGKSTLFNAVSGFVKAGTGTITFLGQRIDDLPPHERARLGIGRTFQLIGLATNLSVMENFLLAQHTVASYGVGSALGQLPRTKRVETELRERSEQAITALGFERFTDTPVRNLSHGQKRLVELGCALVTAPELLMLDEPSAGMSPAAAENLADRLRDLRDELGRTVLLIEHNIPLVLDVCDEIYVLNFGQVLAHGTTAEIAGRPDVLAAYFGEDVPAPVPAVKEPGP